MRLCTPLSIHLSQGWILLCLQFEIGNEEMGGWVIRSTTSLSIAKCNGKGSPIHGNLLVKVNH